MDTSICSYIQPIRALPPKCIWNSFTFVHLSCYYFGQINHHLLLEYSQCPLTCEGDGSRSSACSLRLNHRQQQRLCLGSLLGGSCLPSLSHTSLGAQPRALAAGVGGGGWLRPHCCVPPRSHTCAFLPWHRYLDASLEWQVGFLG